VEKKALFHGAKMPLHLNRFTILTHPVKEVPPGVVLDYDSEGRIASIDIDNAMNNLDLRELILRKVPANKQTIAA
jgi:hypothetical protein